MCVGLPYLIKWGIPAQQRLIMHAYQSGPDLLVMQIKNNMLLSVLKTYFKMTSSSKNHSKVLFETFSEPFN